MHKGFTLVELLIVITIIGILASAMMLSSGSAVAMAEVSTIISDLRSMKAASMMLYSDSMDYFNTVAGAAASLQVTWLKPYVDNPTKYDGATLYQFTRSSDSRWYVGFNLTGRTPEVQQKLRGKASNIGLLGSPLLGSGNYSSGTAVWMVAR
jgi:general secretion pathway protein G